MSRQVTVTLPDGVFERAKAYSTKNHRTMSNLFLHALDGYLKRYEPKSAENTPDDPKYRQQPAEPR